MTRGEHPSVQLRCSVEGCNRLAYDVSPRSGKLLCEGCWTGVEIPGSGFVEWLRRILGRGRRSA